MDKVLHVNALNKLTHSLVQQPLVACVTVVSLVGSKVVTIPRSPQLERAHINSNNITSFKQEEGGEKIFFLGILQHSPGYSLSPVCVYVY